MKNLQSSRIITKLVFWRKQEKMKSKIQMEGCNEYSFFIKEASVKDENRDVGARKC